MKLNYQSNGDLSFIYYKLLVIDLQFNTKST